MKNFIKTFYSNNFIYKGKEKLSKITILFIAILNIFIFITLGLGIDFQVKVLNNPTVTFPYQCREIINSKNLDNFNEYFYLKDSYNYENKYQNIKNLQIDNRCNEVINRVAEIKKEHDIQKLKEYERQLLRSEDKINIELSYIRENYNTVLFEKLSSQSSDKSIIKDNISTENIKEKYNLYLKENEEIKKEKEELYKNFYESKSIKKLITFTKENKEEINEDIFKLNKKYSLKKELVILAFLFPLVFLFFYLMRRYLEKEKYILYVLFKNILIVTLIPTLISLLSLIYQLLPKIFLEKLLMFFYEIEIPFIVYYFAIAIIIVIFSFFIIKLQKRFKDENNRLKNNSITKIESYTKNICNNCGNKVDYNSMNFCPCCQNKLKERCEKCNETTIKDLPYCNSCGNTLKE